MVQINDPILDPVKGMAGRVALLVEDDDGNRYALTARHIVDSFGMRLTFGRGLSAASGTRIDKPLKDDAEEPMCEAIGRLRLAAGMAVSNGPTLSTIEIATDPGVGDSVHRVTANGTRQRGVIESIGGLVRISNPVTGRSAVFSGSIRIAFEGDDGRLEPGAGGGLVLDARGRALGVIVTGRRAQCYVAPLEPYLRKHDLMLCAEAEADASPLLLAVFQGLNALAEEFGRTRDPETNYDTNPPVVLMQRARRVDYAARPY